MFKVSQKILLEDVCTCMHHDKGYREARRLLDKEYGDPYRIAMAYIKRVLEWQSVKYDDCVGLKQLSFFLTKCKSAMEGLSELSVLNHLPNLQTIVAKLPQFIQGKWRDKVYKLKMSGGQPTFADLVTFVNATSDVMNDPTFSKDALSRKQPEATSKKGQQDYLKKKSSFATNIDEEKQETAKETCLLCNKKHSLEACQDFMKMKVEQRKEFLKDRRLCFACFGENHVSKGCVRRKTCATCHKSHPTLLHIEGFTIVKRDSSKEPDSDGIPKVSCHRARLEQSTILHSILPVLVSAKDSCRQVMTYALMDNGSSGSFVTEGLKKQLGVEGIPTTLRLGTMHGESLVDSSILKGLTVMDAEGKTKIELPKLYTREEIPVDHDQIPTPEIARRWKHLKGVASVIPEYQPNLEIGLLIGANCPSALEPLKVVPSNGEGPFAVQYRLGWTVNGPIKVNFEEFTNKVTVNRISVIEASSVKEVISPESIHKMFELDFNERNSNDLAYSQEDNKFLCEVEKNTQFVNGHYVVPLVFKKPEVALPDNREAVLKRAHWQRRKMLKQENFKYKSDYVNFVNDVIMKGYAEKVPEQELQGCPGKVWYIPHHGIYHSKKPEKIRVVFDCSAKFDGVSLNDNLIQGPDLTNSLVGVLTRFREDTIAFMADIEAMFHQVRMSPDYKDFLRFFWWPDGDLSASPQEYRMVVHLFGAVSSPSCANFALKKTADHCENEFGKEVADTLRRNFYVDDCLRSVSNENAAVNLIQGLRESCSDNGFHLTKFTSNSRKVIESIPEDERSKEVRSLNLDCDRLPVERALGVQWCVESDSFGFRITIQGKPCTRRGILSMVSSVFDPLGFATPFILPAR